MSTRTTHYSVLIALLAMAVLLITALAPAQARAADSAWRAEYFPNQWLTGAPIVVRDDPTLDFNWGAGSPHPSLPADRFSARWTRAVYFDGGRYRFTVQADDGVRLFVDGALLLNEWQDQNGPTFTVERDLATGDHALRVEYYENTGGALVRVSWTRLDAPVSGAWRGEYFANPWLSAGPSLIRDDPAINFDWGYGSPAPGFPPDGFSVRWTRTASFDGGRYRFTTATDDGVRLYVDGRLIIDAWREQAVTTYQADLTLSAGSHSMRMEYFEKAGAAVARLTWARLDGTAPPDSAWRGEYFPNRSLAGSPVLVRLDPSINFDWGTGSPDSQLQANNFSVRWTRNLQFGSGKYRFTTVTDDGVRLYIDGRLVIDEWRDMGKETHGVDIQLSSGVHNIRMEYYEKTGAAYARLSWEKIPPKRDVGNIITCARPLNSWVMVYRLEDGAWLNVNPRGFSPISSSGYLKIDGLPVDTARYGGQGHPYKVELWADNRIIRSVGDTFRGEPEFRVRAWTDNYTPWGCPAP